MNETRDAILKKIRSNIAQYGHHIYVISGSSSPRYAYTIGLHDSIGYELILAGVSCYMLSDLKLIINEVASRLENVDALSGYSVEAKGVFSFQRVESSWVEIMMLGWFDYYGSKTVKALQVLPDRDHWTIDVPDLSKNRSVANEPIWQWLDRDWSYPVPKRSIAATNMAALKGARITEVMRWEEDYWELIAGAGPDVKQEDCRMIPLGTLLAYDSTLEPVVRLENGRGLWRSALELTWNNWGS